MQSVCAENQDVEKHVPLADTWWSSNFAFLMPVINNLVCWESVYVCMFGVWLGYCDTIQLLQPGVHEG